MAEETFGPTLPIVKVADADEAVRRANHSNFGLAASVFTRDHDKGRAIAERIDSGSVNVNNVMTNVFQLPVPFGGQRNSGLGVRHGGAAGIRKYCWQKSIIEERFNLPSEIYWYPTKARNIRLMTRAARLLSAGDWRRRLHLR
jgi:acyl-CoA reductase-like NAD-dependent aldehyde dehydrogenase